MTFLVPTDLFRFGEVLDAAIASGSTGAYPKQFAELDTVLADIRPGVAG